MANGKTRSPKEINAAREELCDKLSYQRHLHTLYFGRFDGEIGPEEISEQDLATARRLELKYGEENLNLCDDFGWGVLRGRAEALAWALGEDWPTEGKEG